MEPRGITITTSILAIAIAAACTGSTTAPAEEPRPTPAVDAPPAEPAPADPGARPPVTTSFQMEGMTLVLPGPVTFEDGSDRISPEAEAPLWVAVDFLAAREAITMLRIEGHTSSEGPRDANLTLSKQRALAVARWLVAHGVDCRRLLPVGFGGDKPIAPSDTPENRARNHRIALVHAALRDRPIGGMPMDGGGAIAGDPCE